MTRLTYDPPFEPIVPSSQADSEVIRKVIDYYRRSGKDEQADYLEAILDEREGFEERHLGPGPDPSGSEQEVHAGNGGGGANGEKTTVGVTSFRKQRGDAYRDVFANMGKLEERLSSIGTINNLSVKPSLGAWASDQSLAETEPSYVVEFEGNGQAASAIAKFAQQSGQDGVIFMEPCSGGDCDAVARYSFNEPVVPELRSAMNGFLASEGLGGWAWFRGEDGERYMRAAVPPEGSMQRFSAWLSEAKISNSQADEQAKVRFYGSDDYDNLILEGEGDFDLKLGQ